MKPLARYRRGNHEFWMTPQHAERVGAVPVDEPAKPAEPPAKRRRPAPADKRRRPQPEDKAG